MNPDTKEAKGIAVAGGRWQALAVLALSIFLGMTTWFSASAVLPQLRAEWGLSSTAGSLLTISVQLGFVAGSLVSAILNLADILAPRRLMLMGALGSAVANAALLSCTGVRSALLLRFATGACLALVYPSGLKAMATWFRQARGTALGVMVGALTLGSALPHLLNGLGGVQWRLVVVATSCLTLAGGLIAEFVGTDGPFPFPKGAFDPVQAVRAFSNRSFRLAALGYFGHMWELYAMWTWFGMFFAEVLSRNGHANAQRDAAFATFLVIGLGAVGCWVGGVLGDRWGRAQLISLALGLSGTCALLIGRDGMPASLVLVLGLVWGFWVVADSAQFSTIVTETGDQSYVGTAVTVQLAIGFTLTILTIWLVPVLRATGGWRWAFSSLALGPALGLIAMFRLMRASKRVSSTQRRRVR